MSSRRVTSLFLLVFAVAGERFAYYALRTHVLMGWSAYTPYPSGMFTWQTWLGVIGALAAGAISITINPRIPAIGGLGIMMLGAFLNFAGVAPPVMLGMLGLGSGIFRPCVYAFAGRAFMDENDDTGIYLPNLRRFARMASFMMLVSLTSNIAAYLSTTVASNLGFTFGTVLATLGLVIALVFVIVSVATDRGYLPAVSAAAPVNTAYRSAPGGAQGPDLITLTNAMPMLLLIAAAVGVLEATYSFSRYDYSYSMRWARIATPFLTILSAAICAGVFHGASQSTSRLMPIRGFGVALGIIGVIRMVESLSVDLAALLGLVDGVLEPLTMVGIAYAAACTRTRFSPLIVAGFYVVTVIAPTIATALSVRIPYLGIVGGLVVVGLGVTTAAISSRITAAFEPKGVGEKIP